MGKERAVSRKGGDGRSGDPPAIQMTPSLYLIPLDQELTGFRSFISAWLYRGEKTFLVDPGPAATIHRLIHALEDLSVNRLDAVLLTHIHIDHAGGIGEVARHFRHTPVVCHASAIKHLVDPSRLWEGSLKTLGDTARAYGPIRPVPADRIVDADRYPDPAVIPIATPGHAVHHVSYRVGRILFAGEAGGVFRQGDGGRYYLRPATPPRFFLETSIRSIESLMAVPHEGLCYGHFGLTQDTPGILEAHKAQIYRWARVIGRQRQQDPGTGLVRRCMARLLAEDPLVADFHRMDPDVRERERQFITNSIRGFLGYFEDCEADGP